MISWEKNATLEKRRHKMLSIYKEVLSLKNQRWIKIHLNNNICSTSFFFKYFLISQNSWLSQDLRIIFSFSYLILNRVPWVILKLYFPWANRNPNQRKRVKQCLVNFRRLLFKDDILGYLHWTMHDCNL